MRHTARRIAHFTKHSWILEQSRNRIHEPNLIQLSFLQNNRGTCALQSLSVTALMIIGCQWKRHENRRLTRGGDLRDRARARPAQNYIGAREKARHVVDELVDFDGNSGLRVCRLGFIVVALAGLMDNVQSGHSLQQFRQRTNHYLIDGAGALTAAKYKHGWRALQERLGGNLKERWAHGNAGHHSIV